MAEKFRNSKGSKPVQGNISDSYRKDLYWFLKSMSKEDIEEFKTKSKKFINL